MHNARRYGGAFGLSLVWHGLLVCVAILLIGTASEPASRVPVPQTTFKYVHVMTPAPGPTGGGGGSRAPLPPRSEAIVRPAAAPQPVPIAAVPIAIETPPRPTLDVAISPTTPIVQGVGTSLTSIGDLGGNGRGRGLGDGDGPGAGPGRGGNEGGGPRQVGNGVLPPILVKRVEPVYTDGAMRARIQGEVHLQAVIRADGTVGELKVIRSLDPRTGLDLEAMRVARQWLFKPATYQGRPVDVYVTLILEFRLH